MSSRQAPPPQSGGGSGRAPATEQSYGGLVVRGDLPGGTAECCVIVPRGRRALALPKGGADGDETPEATAEREVREETGLVTTVRARLGDVTYHYRRSGRRTRKTVTFFLCDFVSGTTADHDHEVTDARWIPLAEAPDRLTYPGERHIARRALDLLARDGRDR